MNLSVAIQADVSIELEGADDSPGVKEGGILEHVVREVTIEALPEAIPDSITVNVSEMVIGDTVQLDTIEPPEGVTFMAEAPEEVTIATLNPPRVEEEPEVEVGPRSSARARKPPRARATRVATSPPARATTATRVSPPCPYSAASAAAPSHRGLHR